MKGLIRKILKEQVDYSNFCLPIKGWHGTTIPEQKFGARRYNSITKKVSKHKGIDLGNDSGSNLYAPEDGTVEKAMFFPPYGQPGYNACGGYIKINHANNIDTKYCHLKQIDVLVGDPVVRGQVIGKTGGDSAANSPSGVNDKGRGNSSNAHLHYEVLINGTKVNPDPDFVRNGECDGTVVITPPVITIVTGCTVG